MGIRKRNPDAIAAALLPEGHVIIVDKEDEHFLYDERFAGRWRLLHQRRTTKVVCYYKNNPVFLSRLVLGLDNYDGNKVYHKNYDPLDCRKKNLLLNVQQNTVKCPFTPDELADLYLDQKYTLKQIARLVWTKTGKEISYSLVYRWLVEHAILPQIPTKNNKLNPTGEMPYYFWRKVKNNKSKLLGDLFEGKRQQSDSGN